MRFKEVAITTITSPRNQGFATGDDQETESFLIESNPASERMLAELKRLLELDMREREQKWLKNHPNLTLEDIGTVGGEEFVGGKWITIVSS